MIHRIYQWLIQPYPFEKGWNSAFRTGLWAGAFVALFLYFFRPFGMQINRGEEWAYLKICSFFGLVTLAVMLIVSSLSVILPKIFDEEKWLVWKEMLFNIFFVGCVGAGNLLLAHFLWHVPLNAGTFATWQMLTFAVGIFPIMFGAYMGQMKMNRRYVAEAARMSLQVHPHAITMHSQVTLTGDNQNEILQLDTSWILFLSAADNYVQVFYTEDGRLKKRILRATMKKMEEALAGYPQFFRCHRTYIANLDKLENVSGNAQGYRLHLAGADETIPVSRNLNETLRARLDET